MNTPKYYAQGYAPPVEAMQVPHERNHYTIVIFVGTGIQRSNYLATSDADPDSAAYSHVNYPCEMPGKGDMQHHAPMSPVLFSFIANPNQGKAWQ